MAKLTQPPKKDDVRFDDWLSILREFIIKFDLSFAKGDALPNFANDAAAAAGGVKVGGLYRNGSVLMVRVS